MGKREKGSWPHWEREERQEAMILENPQQSCLQPACVEKAAHAMQRTLFYRPFPVLYIYMYRLGIPTRAEV